MGSRNLGKQVAEIYQQLAIDLHMGKEEVFKQRDEIIRTYKEQGKRSEIQDALKELKANYETQNLIVPPDICWLYGDFLEDYLHDVEIIDIMKPVYNFKASDEEKPWTSHPFHDRII